MGGGEGTRRCYLTGKFPFSREEVLETGGGDSCVTM